MLWYGIYVSEPYLEQASTALGGQSAVYGKSVMGEQWDDYQLRSLAYGGNKPFFELLKEYDISTADLSTCFNHPAVKWYKARHIARMDGTLFNVQKPSLKAANKPQTWDERIDLTKKQAGAAASAAGKGIASLGAGIKAKTLGWKEQIAKKEVGEKFKAMFTKKKELPVETSEVMPEAAGGEKEEEKKAENTSSM